jgi:hypothetical protein
LTKAKDREFAFRIEREKLARVEIEEANAPRRLSESDKSALVTVLKSYPKQAVSLWFHAGDREGGVFATDIWSAFNDAHWDAYAPASLLDLAEAGRKERPFIETGISVASTVDDDSRRAVRMLVIEFQKLGFDAYPSNGRVQQSTPSIAINVETRPEGPQGAAKLRRQK